MKETLIQVERTVMKNGKPIVEHFWVKPDQVDVGDKIIVPPTTNYHINQLDWKGD